MYSTIRKTLLTGVLAVALACGYGCKSDELRKKELDILEMKEKNRKEELKLKRLQLTKSGGLEKKVNEPQRNPSVDKTEGALGLPVAPAGRKTQTYTPGKKDEKPKCYLKARGFKFCRWLESKTYGCYEKGRQFEMAPEFIFLATNGPRSTREITGKYRVTIRGKTYHRGRLKRIKRGGRQAFIGKTDFKDDISGNYTVKVTLKEKGTGCTLRFKEGFEYEEPRD